MNIFKQSLISVLFKIVNVPLTVIIGIIIAKVLGPEGRGNYTVIVTISTFVSILGMLGMGNSSIYLINSMGLDFKKVYRSLFWFSLLWGLIIVLISSSLFNLIPSIIGSLESNYLKYIYIISFLMTLNGFISPMLLTKQRVNVIGIVGTLSLVFQIVFILVSYNVYPTLIFQLVVFSYIYSICVSVFAVIIYERAWYLLIPYFNLNIFQKVMAYGIKIYLGNFLLALNMQFDILILNYFRTSQEVGLYSVSVMLCNFLLVIPGAIGPVLYSNWSQDKVTKVETIIRTCRVLFFLLSLIGCFIAILGYPLIKLAFGNDFTEAYAPTIILIPGVIFMGLSQSIFNYFSSKGTPEVITIILVISFIVNVSLNVVLIPIMGIYGASIASLVSYSFSILLTVISFAKKAGVSIKKVAIGIISNRQLLLDIKRYYLNRG